MKSKTKTVPFGLTFVQPLMFGDWPLDKIQELIKEAESKYDLSKHDLEYVSRGGYQVCGQDHGDGKKCKDIITTYGKIQWKRVRP